jgi:hypothetical protein
LETTLLRYFLPEKLLEHFSITHVEELGCVSTKKMFLEIHLEEVNTIPSGYDPSQYESKGFYPPTTIQDFPVRGKAVYLVIKRRRWRHKDRKDEIIYNDYSLIAEGSRITKELSFFLKGTGRYQGGHNK